jgi:hypothetical protein
MQGTNPIPFQLQRWFTFADLFLHLPGFLNVCRTVAQSTPSQTPPLDNASAQQRPSPSLQLTTISSSFACQSTPSTQLAAPLSTRSAQRQTAKLRRLRNASPPAALVHLDSHFHSTMARRAPSADLTLDASTLATRSKSPTGRATTQSAASAAMQPNAHSWRSADGTTTGRSTTAVMCQAARHMHSQRP